MTDSNDLMKTAVSYAIESTRRICEEEYNAATVKMVEQMTTVTCAHIEKLETENEGYRLALADQLQIRQQLEADNARLREELSGISGRLKVMREALIHTAGICNPISGFLKNLTGPRKKHLDSVQDIALTALQETSHDQ